MYTIIGLLLSVFVSLYTVATSPSRVECYGRRGVLEHGVKLDGRFRCVYRAHDPGPDVEPYPEVPVALEYESTIYCTGGTVPIQVNYRTVGCQRVSVDTRRE